MIIFYYFKLKLKIILFIVLLAIIPVDNAFSELELDTYNQVYTAGQPLLVYGKGLPDETLIIRVFAPETAAINTLFRVFVQTTSDGLLIGNDPKELLATTHIHLPSGKVETISNDFSTLHQGLYFVDYTPHEEGTFVFHVVAFNKGIISQGSAATNVLSQNLGGISNQLIKLNSVLNETSDKLTTLKSEISGFGSTLESGSTNIDTSVTSISNSVKNMEEATLQLNSLLFPIVASIGIIVALQITILARRR